MTTLPINIQVMTHGNRDRGKFRVYYSRNLFRLNTTGSKMNGLDQKLQYQWASDDDTVIRCTVSTVPATVPIQRTVYNHVMFYNSLIFYLVRTNLAPSDVYLVRTNLAPSESRRPAGRFHAQQSSTQRFCLFLSDRMNR